MNVKKFLNECAEKDRQKILNSEKSKSVLQTLIKEIDKNSNSGKQPYICPDCGNMLNFNAKFGRFMHENCEQINCWYAADEFGKCVDNNTMRAARIRNYNGQNNKLN